MPIGQCIERLTNDVTEAAASNPTQMDTFCRKKSDEFLQYVGMEMSRSLPPKAKLIKLVEKIIDLHTPDCRGIIIL